jgi:excinuclease UvrABC ATPase subunit
VVASGTPEQVAADPNSHTGEFLSRLVTPKPRRKKVAAAG